MCHLQYNMLFIKPMTGKWHSNIIVKQLNPIFCHLKLSVEELRPQQVLNYVSSLTSFVSLCPAYSHCLIISERQSTVIAFSYTPVAQHLVIDLKWLCYNFFQLMRVVVELKHFQIQQLDTSLTILLHYCVFLLLTLRALGRRLCRNINQISVHDIWSKSLTTKSLAFH